MKIRTLSLILATVFLLTTSFTFAQVSAPSCADYTGLAIYDVTDPSNPDLQGMAFTPYSCNDVALDGDYASGSK